MDRAHISTKVQIFGIDDELHNEVFGFYDREEEETKVKKVVSDRTVAETKDNVYLVVILDHEALNDP